MIQKKTALLFAILVVLVSFVLYFVFKPSTTPQQPTTSTVPVPSEIPSLTTNIPREALLTFDSTTVQINPFQDQAHEATVVLDARIHSVTGVQLEMSYDPEVLSNVTIAPAEPSFFGSNSNTVILSRDVDETIGRITYIVGITPSAVPGVGRGDIAKLSFTVNPTSNAVSTDISILPSSIVSQEDLVNESVLRSTNSLKINITR